MVKVVDRSPEEVAKIESIGRVTGRLVDILNKHFGERFSATPTTKSPYINVKDSVSRDRAFEIDAGHNQIEVYSPKYFDDAVKLAALYEVSEKAEFTVRRDY